MIYAGIMAAGMGARMHRQDFPKPFLMLGSKPIIIHTLEQFWLNDQVLKTIIVVADMWVTYAKELIEKYNFFNNDVVVIAGGANKTESIDITVKYIINKFGVDSNDIFLVHDAIRPFITQRIINENIKSAYKYGAANTIISNNDATVLSDDGQFAKELPSKSKVFAEQSPQTYKLSLLAEALNNAKEAMVNLRYEAELPRLYIKFGGKMKFVDGEYSNMKIINPYDLEVANALLKERQK